MVNLIRKLALTHSNSNSEKVNIFENCVDILENGDVCSNVSQVKNMEGFELKLLHHNVQSLNNKLLEISVMLTVDKLDINILCFTEHWLLDDQLNIINIDQFKLVGKFCRNSSTSGGSCTFTKNSIRTTEVNYFKSLGKNKVFEVSAVELSDFNAILACIYG